MDPVLLLALLLLGLAVAAAELLLFTFGFLALAGVMIYGYALMQIAQAEAFLGVPVTPDVVAAIAGAGTLVLIVVVTCAIRAFSHRATPLLENEIVEIVDWADGTGHARAAGGEVWAATADYAFKPGDRARVGFVTHLTLNLKPLD